MMKKQDAHFSFEDCSCMEMMSLMMAQSQAQPGIEEACVEMMAQFADPEGSDNEFFEMMSQIKASCCELQEEEGKIIKEA